SIVSPNTAITDATVSGAGTFVVTLTVSNGTTTRTCTTTLTAGDGGTAPSEISATGAAEPLRVARDVAAGTLRVTFEDPGATVERFNLYAGTLPPTGMTGYDHAPVACHAAPTPAGAGAAVTIAPLDMGTS